MRGLVLATSCAKNSLVIKAILSVFSTLLYTSGEPWPKTIAQSDVIGSVLTSSSRLTNRQDGFRNHAMYYYAKIASTWQGHRLRGLLRPGTPKK